VSKRRRRGAEDAPSEEVDLRLLQAVPPNSMEAEMCTLGSMLTEAEAIAVATELIRDEDDFYRPTHRKIFSAIRELYERGEPADILTVCERLRQRGDYDDVGGSEYVNQLIAAVPTAANVRHYANIVADKALLRRLIETATRISAMGYRGEEEARETVNLAEQMLFAISQYSIRGDPVEVKGIAAETFRKLEQRYEKKRQ